MSSSAELSSHADFAASVRTQVGKIVVGQETVVERLLIALLTGGHLLLQGVPGIAKTLLVNALAKAIKLEFQRVQFTIDLLPSDILGSEIFDQRSGAFFTRQGPVFTNLLLADEINRAAPKVQSALLEAMQERRVTIGTDLHALPVPFVVIATQNPIEHSGTFELPEAQLDRFMLCHRLTYPTAEQEDEVVRRNLALGLRRDGDSAVPKTCFDIIDDMDGARGNGLVNAMEQVQTVHVSDVFLQHCLDLVRRTREHPDLEFGASPRAGIALATAARARAFLHNRDYALPVDLLALAEDVVLHRIRLTYEALANGRTGSEILAEILDEMG